MRKVLQSSAEEPQKLPLLAGLLTHATNMAAAAQMEDNPQLRQSLVVPPPLMNRVPSFDAFPLDNVQQNDQTLINRRNAERRVPKPESYKTVICQAWLESKSCSFAENCRFAHGEEELRPAKAQPRKNDKYKTKLCDKYTTNGLCPYGKRCLFIHPDNGPNAYIRADKLMEVSHRHALADLRMQMAYQFVGGGPADSSAINGRVPLGATPVRNRFQSTVRPHPSWPLEPATFFMDKSLVSRPVSPQGPLLTTDNAQSLKGTFSTPSTGSGYVSGGSTPMDLDSPFSGIQSTSTSCVPTKGVIDEDSFLLTPGFDHLAEDLARHLDLW